MSDLRSLYADIVNSQSLSSRMGQGIYGIIEPWANGWLVKYDRPGSPPCTQHEIEIYQLLETQGLTGDITPEYDPGESYDGQLILRRINDCIPLDEYAMWCSDPRFSRELWVDLCRDTGLAIRKFHDYGFIHHDLHGRNVVCELNGNSLQPFLIDFGFSSHESLDCQYLSDSCVNQNPEDDVAFLIGALSSFTDSSPEWYQEGLDVLERAALLA